MAENSCSGTELGWPDDQADRLRYARRKSDEFAEEIARFEDRRSSINDKIGDQNGVLDYLHYDLLDAMEREESIKNEWLVDREADKLPLRSQVMPWARGLDEDQRFRKVLAASVLWCLMASLLVSIVDLPIPDRATLTEVPERVAKLVGKKKLRHRRPRRYKSQSLRTRNCRNPSRN